MTEWDDSYISLFELSERYLDTESVVKMQIKKDTHTGNTSPIPILGYIVCQERERAAPDKRGQKLSLMIVSGCAHQ